MTQVAYPEGKPLCWLCVMGATNRSHRFDEPSEYAASVGEKRAPRDIESPRFVIGWRKDDALLAERISGTAGIVRPCNSNFFSCSRLMWRKTRRDTGTSWRSCKSIRGFPIATRASNRRELLPADQESGHAVEIRASLCLRLRPRN